MMQNQSSGLGVPRVQTDAICAACGVVNPEGTMACLGCGNNLAEQHRLRLAQGGPIVMGSGFSIRSIVSGILLIIGLLLVLFVAVMAPQIENMIADVQGDAGPARLWSGAEGAVFTEMAAQLTVPTDEEVAAALEAPQSVTAWPGRYVLITGIEEPLQVGSALIKQEGATVYFVGRINEGGEVRGIFQLPEGGALDKVAVQWADTGLQYNGATYGCAGAALLQESGVVECFGQTELNTNSYEFSAYQLP